METLSYSTNAVRSISKLMDKISSTCDELIGTLEVSKDGVSSYGVRITDNLMDTEFVDRVIGYLMLLKNYMFDLQQHAPHHFQDAESIAHIVEHLRETEAKLKLKMMENNFFFNTYSMHVIEITNLIDKVIEKMPANSAKVISMNTASYKAAA